MLASSGISFDHESPLRGWHGPELVDRRGSGLAQEGLQLGEGVLDRADVGRVGRQNEEAGFGRLDCFAHGQAIVAGRLSRIATSPRLSVETSICSTRGEDQATVMGPSSIMGAVTPVRRSAPTKVVLFRRPSGLLARSRRLRSARP